MKGPFFDRYADTEEQKKYRQAVLEQYRLCIEKHLPSKFLIDMQIEGVTLPAEYLQQIYDRMVELFGFPDFDPRERGSDQYGATSEELRRWVRVCKAAGVDAIPNNIIQRCYRAAADFISKFPNASNMAGDLIFGMTGIHAWPKPEPWFDHEVIRSILASEGDKIWVYWFTFSEFPASVLTGIEIPRPVLNSLFRGAFFIWNANACLQSNVGHLVDRIDGEMLEYWFADQSLITDTSSMSNAITSIASHAGKLLMQHLPSLRRVLNTFSFSEYERLANEIVEKFMQSGLSREEAEEAVKIPWFDAFVRMKKIQAHTENEAYDPWTQDLGPLIDEAVKAGLLSRERTEDGELVEAFVKRYGMNNLPNIFRWFVWMSRAKSMEDLTDEQKKEIADGLGIKIEKFKNKGQIHVELKRMQEEIRKELLADEIPDCFRRAPIASWEMFKAMKGATRWEQHDDFSKMVEELDTWKRERPEDAALLAGYERMRVEVDEGGRQSATVEAQIQKMLDEYPALREEASRFYEKIELAKLNKDEWGTLDPLWRSLAVRWQGEFIHKEQVTETMLENMRSFLADYMLEHYLHPAQEKHWTGHEPFDEKKLLSLRWGWGLGGDPEKNPIFVAHQRVKEMRRANEKRAKERAAKKTVTLDLVPVRGLLRAYAGDIGDACYTSRHEELARGEYPGITAFVYVAKPGTPQERWAGSVLAIETHTDDGEPALLVRANNPRQNVIAGLDADAFVGQVMACMIESP